VRDYVCVDDVVCANLRAREGSIPTPIVKIATGEAITALAEAIGAMQPPS
jgi:hypothetical protein